MINSCTIDKDELNKYLNLLSNCISDTIPIISSSIRFNNLFINQENFKLLTKFANIASYLLDKSQERFFEFDNEINSIFKIIYFNTNFANTNSSNCNFEVINNCNFYLINNNISSNVANNIIASSNANCATTLDLTFIKTHIYSFMYKSIGNVLKTKEINFKSFTNEIMNFLEVIILKHNVFFILIFYCKILFYFFI